MKRTSRLATVFMYMSIWMCVLCFWSQASWGQGSPAGGELTVALSSLSTETLDPALGGHIVKYYMSLIFDYLVGTTPDGKLSPASGIATKWEMTPDKNGWVFELRQGVKFHNGEELTAEDVKASLQRGIGPISTTGYAGALRSSIKEIEIVNPHKLIIHTKAPSIIIPPYLSRGLSTEGVIMPSAPRSVVME